MDSKAAAEIRDWEAAMWFGSDDAAASATVPVGTDGYALAA